MPSLRSRFRSAITGRFMRKDDALRRPKNTVEETVPAKQHNDALAARNARITQLSDQVTERDARLRFREQTIEEYKQRITETRQLIAQHLDTPNLSKKAKDILRAIDRKLADG